MSRRKAKVEAAPTWPHPDAPRGAVDVFLVKHGHCPDCNGTGGEHQVPCDDCEGRKGPIMCTCDCGHRHERERCTTCHDRGTVTAFCARCDGAGKYVPATMTRHEAEKLRSAA